MTNKLFDSPGLRSSIHDALCQHEIQALNAGRSRALVLRDLIEIPDFKNMVCAFLTSAEYQLRFGAGVTRTNGDCAE